MKCSIENTSWSFRLRDCQNQCANFYCETKQEKIKKMKTENDKIVYKFLNDVMISTLFHIGYDIMFYFWLDSAMQDTKIRFFFLCQFQVNCESVFVGYIKNVKFNIALHIICIQPLVSQFPHMVMTFCSFYSILQSTFSILLRNWIYIYWITKSIE